MHRFIPTPSFSMVGLGPLKIHVYAICILAGIVIAVLLGQRRYKNLGGNPEDISDIAVYVIPAGVIGGRIYHVITTPELYFGATGNWQNAFKIWEGGLGIWGAISLGALVAYLAFRSKERSLTFPQLADALAPGILIAQGVGRFGNWFNAELYGKPTDLPWALKIPIAQRSIDHLADVTYHPTFLYEALWCFAGAVILLKWKKLRTLPAGKLFLAYILIYTSGRTWIETLRIDSAHTIAGIRLNVWVAGVVFLVTLLVVLRKAKPKEVE